MVNKKKKTIKAKKKDIEAVDNLVREDEVMVPKEIEEKETRQLIWFFVIVGLVFAVVLVPYFWNEANKSFEFGGADWVIEDYENLRIFHGRFISLANPNLNYNVFFRTDPRKNDVEVSGKLSDFKYGGVISLSPEVDDCRGELSRVMLDLGAFLRQGVGVGPIESGSISEEIANASGRRFANCDIVGNRTVVIVEIGKKRGVVKSDVNPDCYILTAANCEDSDVVEKFMMRSVMDFREKYPLKKVKV